MFADIGQLHTALIEKEPRDFVSHYLFEPIPFLFGGDLSVWISWKTSLARGLQVDPHDIVLTGSAAVGYSLNPTKGYKRFDESSDVDCGVVSQYHFEVAWRYLRLSRPLWLQQPSDTKRALNAHRLNYVFAGTIATDSILALLPFGAEWQGALDTMATMAPTVGRDVRLRIYRDYDSLRHYQARGIERLRNELMAATPADIGIEE